MLNRNVTHNILSIAVLSLAVLPANGASISLDFSGVWSQADAGHIAAASVGDPFSGMLVYDDSGVVGTGLETVSLVSFAVTTGTFSQTYAAGDFSQTETFLLNGILDAFEFRDPASGCDNCVFRLSVQSDFRFQNIFPGVGVKELGSSSFSTAPEPSSSTLLLLAGLLPLGAAIRRRFTS